MIFTGLGFYDIAKMLRYLLSVIEYDSSIEVLLNSILWCSYATTLYSLDFPDMILERRSFDHHDPLDPPLTTQFIHTFYTANIK